MLYAAGWSLDSFLQNLGNAAKVYGGYIVILIGIVLVLFGVVSIFKAINAKSDRGESPTPHIVKAVLSIIIGGAMSVMGWQFAELLSSGGAETVQDLGQGGLIILSAFFG